MYIYTYIYIYEFGQAGNQGCWLFNGITKVGKPKQVYESWWP